MTTLGRKHRTPLQRDADRARIGEMYLRGTRQSAIARELGLSADTIGNELKKLRVEWLESSLMDFSEAKAQQLAKIDALELEYWESYRRSRGPEELDNGDVRYLAGVQWCIAERARVLGMYAPIKAEQHIVHKKGYEGVTPDDWSG